MINIYDPKAKLQFVSRETLKQALIAGTVPDRNVVIISISDTSWEALEMLSLFNEYEGDRELAFYVFPDEEIGLPEETAKSILRVVDDANKVGAKIIVHCLMGISRSGAVAKFINEYLGLDNWFLESYHNHNKSIYSSLTEVAGLSLASMDGEMEAIEHTKVTTQFFKAKGKEEFIVIEHYHNEGYKKAKHYTNFYELNGDLPDSYDEFVSHIPSIELLKEFDDCSEWVELNEDEVIIVKNYISLCINKGV